MESRSLPFSLVRDVLLNLIVALVIAQAFIVFWYRPANPYSYQQVEVKLAAVISLLVTTSIVLFLPEILSALFGCSRRVYKSRYMKLPVRFIGWLSATPAVRLLSSFLSGCLRKLFLFLSKCRYAYLHSDFAPGRRNEFVSIGVAIVFIVSPFVLIFNQQYFCEPAVLFFLAYAAYSRYIRLDSRAMIVAAFVLLGMCPFLLSFNDTVRADLSAIYAYYCLCTGVLLMLLDCAQNPKSLAYAVEE